MTDIDRQTGLVIDNLTSVFQQVEMILSTRIASLVMSRNFGGGVVELLGKLVTPALFDAFRQLVGTAIDLWEPRFHVLTTSLDGTVNEIRSGKAALIIEVEYMPRALHGDFSVERITNFGLLFTRLGVRVRT